MYLQKNLSLFMEEDDDVNGTLNKILINDSFSWTLLKFTQVNAEGGRACTHMAWFSILTLPQLQLVGLVEVNWVLL